MTPVIHHQPHSQVFFPSLDEERFETLSGEQQEPGLIEMGLHLFVVDLWLVVQADGGRCAISYLCRPAPAGLTMAVSFWLL